MTTKLMENVKAQGAKGEQALAALAELLRTAKRREQWRQSKARIRARERAHRSWVNTVGTVNGREIRPLPMSYVRARASYIRESEQLCRAANALLDTVSR